MHWLISVLDGCISGLIHEAGPRLAALYMDAQSSSGASSCMRCCSLGLKVQQSMTLTEHIAQSQHLQLPGESTSPGPWCTNQHAVHPGMRLLL